MKKIVFISAIILLAFVFVSCAVETKIVESEGKEEVLVSLNFGGEYVQVHDTPLQVSDSTTRSIGEGKDLYLVQVYYLPVNGDTYSPFCYGVFNDVSNLKLKLVKGQTYRIAASVIVDGYDFLTVYSNLATNPGNPGKQITSTTDGFVSDTTNQMNVMGTYYIRKSGQSVACDNPEMDRYGVISDVITVGDDLSEITLTMKRFVFGIKINVSGLESGSVIVKCTSNTSSRIFISDKTIIENGSIENEYCMSADFSPASSYNKASSFDNIFSRYFGENPVTERHGIKVIYKDVEGSEYELYNGTITFTRLEETVLDIIVPSATDLNKKSISLCFSFESNATIKEGETIAVSY